ncbi:flagellar biosynthetic protein FliR [Microbulbifer rhizosphaerae]|uniref:Flagellar biosynthetic protein FliR n=1 Tax=Microbulbifer rhizosphaerae TaxID=1562603 RepID=A0A7W4WFX9_9GAMM|nr:flagellar biosynthetic protein FliR [Microbulbifer rhizosphaerae]MBB3063480.1 flagellar biosynthetic protein FliR [Microbulbifer rhizosphaerae]
MLFQASLDFVTSILLIATRLAPIFFALPLQAVTSLPLRVRFFLVMAFSVVLVTLLPDTGLNIGSSYELVIALLKEFSVGLALSAAIMAAFSAFSVAGRLIDFQMGLGAATLFNPLSNSQNSLIGTLLTLMGTLIFFLVDGHLALIRGIKQTFVLVPIGGGLKTIGFLEAFLAAGKMFLYGATLAAPVILGLFLIDFVIAVFARTMPQLNPYFVGLPFKIFMGLMLLTLSLNYFSNPIRAIFESIFGNWTKVLVA